MTTDQSLRDRLADSYLSLIPLISLNIIWFVCTVPLLTAIPATAALFYATNRLAHGGNADWRTFFEGFRVCFRRSWAWGLMNLLIGGGLVGYFFYFSQLQDNVGFWARAAVCVAAFLWLMIQLYTFPLLLEQEQPRLLQALRNSLVALLRRPLHSVGYALLVVVVVVGTTFLLTPAWVFITASLCAYLANRATLNAIAAIRGNPSQQSAIQRTQPPDSTIETF